MKRVILMLLLAMLTGSVMAAAAGPAPNSGDGVSDGSGMVPLPANTGQSEEVSGPAGPNPLAGDGVPDGSTVDSPNGPNR